MKIYLSGPMTGLPENNHPLFNATAKTLRDRGFEVYNPAENDAGSRDKDRKFYLRLDLESLAKAEAIVLLPGWQGSAGTRLELTVAKALELEVNFWDPDTQTLHVLEMDDINRPAHYDLGGIEVIQAIEAWKLDYHLGNVVKYIARAKYKGKELEDLEKALWYLTRKIEQMKKEQHEQRKAAA